MTAPSPTQTVTLTVSQLFLDHAQSRHRRDPLAEAPGPTGKSPDAEVVVNLRLADDSKSAAVTVQVSSDDPEGNYLYNVAYVAVLAIETEADLHASTSQPLRDRILISGAGMAMPFVREAVGNLTGRGRFGATWINPVNFAQFVKSGVIIEESTETPMKTPSP